MRYSSPRRDAIESSTDTITLRCFVSLAVVTACFVLVLSLIFR